MPSVRKVVRYWAERGGPFQIDLGRPACFSCDVAATAWEHLERGHILDRWCGGLDGPQNLAMLCSLCHAAQPIFEPGQEVEALAWMAEGGWLQDEQRIAEKAHQMLTARMS